MSGPELIHPPDGSSYSLRFSGASVPIIRARPHVTTRPRSDFTVFHGAGFTRGARYLVICQGHLGFVTCLKDTGFLQPVILTDPKLKEWGLEQVRRGEVDSVDRDWP